MRITTVILIASLLQVSAAGLAQKVTLSENKTVLTKVFDKISVQTGYDFLFTTTLLKNAKTVTIQVNNANLNEVLKEIFEDQPFVYIIKEKSVVIKEKPSLTFLDRLAERWAAIDVWGVVRNEKGEAQEGITVCVKGTNKRTVTNAKGVFLLRRVNEDASLVFSGVCIETHEVKINGRKELNVNVRMNQVQLEEVTINTGYQSISKERSAGSFTKVDGDAIQKKSVSMNVIDRLEGLVPGFTVNQGEGADKFLIRGVSSVNASRMPLYVLDGIPMLYEELSRLLNPNDVEDVVFLKDATASSIWGAQAANGVVVITTKKGKTNSGKIKVDYNGFVSFKGLPDYSYQHMMSTEQFIKSAREIFDPVIYNYDVASSFDRQTGPPIIMPHEKILYDEYRGLISGTEANRRLDSLGSLNNRSQIEGHLLQPAMLTNHSVAFSGGNNFHNYYGSLGYTNEQKTDKSALNQYMLNFRQQFIFSHAIKLDITTNLSQENSNRFIIPNLPFLNTYAPYAMFTDEKGNSLSQSYLQMFDDYRRNAEQLSKINLDYNPLRESEYTKNNRAKTLSARLNAGLNIRLFKGLQFEGRYQYQTGNTDAYTFYSQDSYLARKEVVNFTVPGTSPQYYLPQEGGQLQSQIQRSTSWAARNQLTYSNNWEGVHQLTLMAGSEMRNNKVNSTSNLLRGYNFQTQQYVPYDEKSLYTNGVFNTVIPNSSGMSIMTGTRPFSSAEKETRFVSFYGNLAYGFKQRYDLNISVRMDQSNLFGTDISHQYKPIWSAGLSWLINKEGFFSADWVNLLKMRVSYGIGGNSPSPGSGGPYDVLKPMSHPWYSGLGQGYAIVRPANDKLIWERTATFNVGMDVALFNNRLSVNLDFYDKNTTDLLGDQSFDPTNGWFSGYTNMGNITNKGIELGVQSVNINTRDFSWRSGFNFAWNRNKIVRLGRKLPLDIQNVVNGTPFIEGYSAYAIFAYKWAGLDDTGAPRVYNAKNEIVKNPSELKPEDAVFAGTAQPVFSGGLTNTFTYKSWELSFLTIFNLGHKMRKDVNGFYSGRMFQNLPEYFEYRWKKPGDEKLTDVPAYIADPAMNSNSRYTDFYNSADINIVSASYIKLRDLSLTYHLPASLIRSLPLSGLDLYGQVNNILLWTANKHDIDPEYYNAGSANSRGRGINESAAGGTIVPAPKSRPDRMKAFYTVGIRVNFK